MRTWRSFLQVLIACFAIQARCDSANAEATKIDAERGRATVIKRQLKGRDGFDLLVSGKAKETLLVEMTSKNLQAYFNVLPEASETAIFNGSSSGNRFEGALPSDGNYIIRAYLMRAAGRRNEQADVSIKILVTAGSEPARPAPVEQAAANFDRSVTLQGISFQVTSANAAEKNSVTISPKGLAVDNSPVTVAVDGQVINAEAGDINADGSPEIYVTVRGPEPDMRGSVVGYSTNAKKSMSPITVPPLSAKQSMGYRGRDEFAVVEGILARRFPIHSESGKPTNKLRQIQYKLKHGEASWKLTVDRFVEF